VLEVPMNQALLYLLVRSFVNSMIVRVRRLRRPKYLVGALLGCAYFYFYFYRLLYRGAFAGGPDVDAVPVSKFSLDLDVRMNLAALGLFAAIVVFGWILPSSRAALNFSEAEVAWLFPAPLSRRQLVRFRIIKAQVGLLVLALLMTLFTGRLARDGHAILHTLGWWILLMTLQLHRLAASFTITTLTDRGLSTLLRRLLALTVGVGFLGLLVLWARQAPELPRLDGFLQPGVFGEYIRKLVGTGSAQWLLLPFRWVVQPWFAADGRAFMVSLAPAAGVVFAHYVWVMRSEVGFEEASVQLSEKRAAMLAAQRAGNARFRSLPRLERQSVFALSPVGWPALAFVWKSWIRFGGQKSVRLAIFGGLSCVVVATIPLAVPDWQSYSSAAVIVGTMAMCGLLFSGPQLTAQGLRQELQAVEWLKACPVPASQIVFGQLLGPALAWAAIEWAAVLVMLVGALATPPERLADPVMCAGWIAVGSLIFLPPFNLVASLVPSGVMLLFPGWFKPGESRGIEATGLGILMVVAQIVFLAVAMIPAGLAMAGATFGARLLLPPIPSFALGSIFAAGTLALEGWFGALVLGTILSRFDASAER
jgi:hypothetical protein